MTEPDGDPTADFLAEVRPEETPWRTDRPADAAGEPVPKAGPEPGRARSVVRAVGEAAPYVQAGLFAAWIAMSIADSSDGGGSSSDFGGGQTG
ncbi:hypothetical protein [Amycolatopsis echigonensis]|uniref:Uncharacterized protein n=1 Tax=Amycolatopsis echigonensis TaxID=2576905 RepID=A0A2N3X077_9PSEU|nr:MULTISPECIES: hypothetical protein [Amycolatopsis]MBB2504347.1 hypothetical protein [Amycolatopsis echigonensis]PKV99517.1 hypothetical protein ATK30_0494 [Amycolatopsis niigatensis]